MTQLEPLMEQNFLEYASYVIMDRAIPDIRDGCKPVQRRILATLHNSDDGKFHKVANIIGETMKLHPHGDASIGDALVVLANKEYFIERQGNFGNIITGHRAAAARYIECRLTPLARETLFNKHLTDYQPSYDGRKEEPVYLPAKLPVALMLGVEGIAVGMSTKVLPHNFIELLEAQIALLRKEPIMLYPDFQQGGIMDVSGYEDGRGKVRVRALIEAVGDKKVVIREVPFTTTTESLIASIESAIGKGKVKITGIDDFTTDTVEIELTLSRGVYADEVIPQLYAYTDCEVSVNTNIVVIKDDKPCEMTVAEILRLLTEQLRGTLQAELEWERGQLENKRHWLTLEQIFIENRVYKRIEEATTEEAVNTEVYDGMMAFKHLFVRDMVDEDIKRLLEIRIRRISKYDIDKNRKDIDDIIAAIEEIDRKLKRMRATTITYIKGLLKKYADLYPRRTKIEAFEEINVKAVARASLKISYDAKTGFIGTAIRGDKYQMTVSEFDRILIVCADGGYRIISPSEKQIIPGKIIYCQLFDEEKGAAFTCIYRDKKKNVFAKKFHLLKYTRNREYELIKDKLGKIDYLLEGDQSPQLHLSFVPAARQKVKEQTAVTDDIEIGGAGIRGKRLAPKPVAKIKVLK